MKTHSIKVIDSTYSIDDAKEVILSLLNDKIRFLGAKKFSNTIRFGEEGTHLDKRIMQLTEEIENLKSLTDQINKDELDAKIDCNLNIEFVPVKELV
ncbi:MAG: hypothetical protein ABJF11_19300 [Reichenbachiella sp.]|uniref:hypothetical protein n=1 Tax=Reichenbachiella sp. TaxID=2184521 RepID=UPI0032650CF2